MKRLIKYTALLLLTIYFSSARAQEFPSRIWHEGYLVTAKEDTARGLVKYDIDSKSRAGTDLQQYENPVF